MGEGGREGCIRCLGFCERGGEFRERWIWYLEGSGVGFVLVFCSIRAVLWLLSLRCFWGDLDMSEGVLLGAWCGKLGTEAGWMEIEMDVWWVLTVEYYAFR